MEVNDSELRNEMRYAIKFCLRLGEIAPGKVWLMKEVSKDKYFGEFMIFSWRGNTKFL